MFGQLYGENYGRDVKEQTKANGKPVTILKKSNGALKNYSRNPDIQFIGRSETGNNRQTKICLHAQKTEYLVKCISRRFFYPRYPKSNLVQFPIAV